MDYVLDAVKYIALPFHPVDPRQRGHHVSPLHNHNSSPIIMRFFTSSIVEFG